MATEAEVTRVKERYSMQLMSKPGIVGVGVEKDEDGEYVLAVHLGTPGARETLPDEIEGVRLKPIHTGPYKAFGAE
ncbi:MAG TPA: hypothetical protein VEZ11_06895 [Thermoanaerobaculia bacterium]|nr:hypothetical protein [Thermoanaerobaculia bacterium]